MAKVLRQYQSVIYGSYRIWGLRYGLLTGLLLAVVLLSHRLFFPSTPPAAPEDYIVEFFLLIALFGAAYHYRSRLPEGKVMLKELLLLGIISGFVAAVVYGLLLWLLCGVVFPDMVDTFVQTRLSLMPPATESAEAAMAVQRVEAYGAGDWAFIGGFRLFVISVIITFFSAIIFRTEQSPLKS